MSESGGQMEARDAQAYCSFCGKSQHEVSKLIAGPAAYMCNECVDLSYEICHEREKIVGLRPDFLAEMARRIEGIEKQLAEPAP